MKKFEQRELNAAAQHAADGGQALHMMHGSFAYGRKDTPSVFKGRKQIAHLFDQNLERLKATARRLGVRVIKVERLGHKYQHIDLCAGPLDRAIRETTHDQPPLLPARANPLNNYP